MTDKEVVVTTVLIAWLLLVTGMGVIVGRRIMRRLRKPWVTDEEWQSRARHPAGKKLAMDRYGRIQEGKSHDTRDSGSDRLHDDRAGFDRGSGGNDRAVLGGNDAGKASTDDTMGTIRRDGESDLICCHICDCLGTDVYRVKDCGFGDSGFNRLDAARDLPLLGCEFDGKRWHWHCTVHGSNICTTAGCWPHKVVKGG